MAAGSETSCSFKGANQLLENKPTFFARADAVEEIVLGRRVALYRSGAERAVILNKTGSLLWKRLENPQSRRELTEYLQTQFPEISEEQLLNDASNFLCELSEAKFVGNVDKL